MIPWASGRGAEIAAQLGACGHVDALSPCRWRLVPADSGPSIEATWDGAWLRLDRAHPAIPESMWSLLCLGAGLPPAVKIGAVAVSNLYLATDIDLAASFDLGVSIRVAIDGLAEASTSLAAGAAPVPPPAADDALLNDTLRDACAATGWKCTSRSFGRLAVDLDVSGDFAQAIVEQGRHMVVVRTALLDEADIADATCREAVAVILLSLNHHVRGVRAVAGPGTAAPWLETRLPEAGAAELQRAFGAHSTAWALAGREASMMAVDPHFAQLFLQTMRARADRERRDADRDSCS